MNLHISFRICWKRRDLANLFVLVSILPTKNITHADRNILLFTTMPSLSMCGFLSTSTNVFIKIKKHTATSGIRKPSGWQVEVMVIGHHFYFLFSYDSPPPFLYKLHFFEMETIIFSSLILLNRCLKHEQIIDFLYRSELSYLIAPVVSVCVMS